MARAFAYLVRTLVALLAVLISAAGAGAQDGSTLFEQPVLIIDPGMHTADLVAADTDASGRFAVTGSYDRTVRVWQLGPKPELTVTIRIPSGQGEIGKIYAVAMSPDGSLIAAGGWTRWSESDPHEQIYLFSRSGQLLRRIHDLPSQVTSLTFSRDGRYLAAGLKGRNGIRIYDRDKEWAEASRDIDYGEDVRGLAFSADGRLATTSFDDNVRLYDTAFKLTAKRKELDAPYGIAFHPGGHQLAVGFADRTAVARLDGRSLERLGLYDEFDSRRTSIQNLSAVAWSEDGNTLFATGTFPSPEVQKRDRYVIVAWAIGGTGSRQIHLGSTDAITALKSLPNGALLVSAYGPHLEVVKSDGTQHWAKPSPSFDPRYQERDFSVSPDGAAVEFAYSRGRTRARFDLANLKLTIPSPQDGLTLPPRQAGLPVYSWQWPNQPELAGKKLPLEPAEVSWSLAIHPKNDRFVLGTDLFLRAFDADGRLLWRRSIPSYVPAVNITGDGRMAVAAYGDGTIRWHRMDDGRELLAFFPLLDGVNWVAWTPEGIYAATAGTHGVLRWHVNRGWDRPGEAIPVSEIPRTNRPNVLPLVIQEMDHVRALGLAEQGEIRQAIKLRTGAAAAPGARLHFLSVGVGEYGEHAKHLRLNYAAKDALDIASALQNTQGSLYAAVLPQVLTDKEASQRAFFRALGAMATNMQAGGGNDVAVVMFSGHGAVIDGRYYLLPYDVDGRSPLEITTSAISVDMLRQHLTKLAEHGRVLVLLDACRSGAATAAGAHLEADGGLLRSALAGLGNVTVLTSSSSAKPSYEDEAWKNGAFTKVFLRALSREADTDQNGLISVGELITYMSRHLPLLTRDKGEQTPGMEVRFQSDIFVSGL